MLPSISTAKAKEGTAVSVDLGDGLVDDAPEKLSKQVTMKRRHTVGVTPRYVTSPLEEKGVDPDSTSARSAQSPRGAKPEDLGKPRFDALTLRQWFSEMDVQKVGHIGKNEWMKFLNSHDNKKLKQIILHGVYALPGRDINIISEKETQREKEALEMRRLLKIWRQLDKNGNGTLEWEEFLNFFRRADMLLEFSDKEHPRARLAKILGDVQDHGSTVDTSTFEEFENLTKVHTHGQRRKSLEVAALEMRPGSPTVADAKEYLAQRLRRRHSISHPGEADVFTGVAPASPASSQYNSTEVKAPAGKPDSARPMRGSARHIIEDLK